MPLIKTELLQPDNSYAGQYERNGKPSLRLSPNDDLQTYCALDCCVTLEVREELGTLFNQPPAIYDFERALQGPYLDMMQRGFLVDDLSRRLVSEELSRRIAALQEMLDDFARACWDKPLNPRSPAQLRDFFYGSLNLPEVWISQKGQRKLSTNREALEKLHDYLYARPFVNIILAIRDLGKQLSVLETEIDLDGRFRTSYNIAGTETGRPSSSSNAYGTGGNAQNVSPHLRYIFVADPGHKIVVIDLEQVEARDVGFFIGCLFGDWKFLDNCESGDLHTNNCKLVWPRLGWTGEPKADRKLADQTFYREFTYRDMSKRGGHLSNYMGTSYTMARSLKIPQQVADEFQARYCRGAPANLKLGTAAILPAFPSIPRYWQWIAQQLQTSHQLVTPFGRQRHFFGRPGDDTTLREAIAFLPQSTTADRMNLGLWRIWKHMPQCQLLAQTYDSVTFQFPETLDEGEIIEQALELIRVELVSPSGRKYIVPGEAKIGWNWGSAVTEADVARAKTEGRKIPRLNLDGLVKWQRGKREARQRQVGIKRRML